jgi:hypothetical protein
MSIHLHTRLDLHQMPIVATSKRNQSALGLVLLYADMCIQRH